MKIFLINISMDIGMKTETFTQTSLPATTTATSSSLFEDILRPRLKLDVRNRLMDHGFSHDVELILIFLDGVPVFLCMLRFQKKQRALALAP
jgi:hypothetical protein